MKINNTFATTMAPTCDDNRTCFLKFRRPTRPFDRIRMALPVAAAIAASVSAAEPALAGVATYEWEGKGSTDWSTPDNWTDEQPSKDSNIKIVGSTWNPIINHTTFDSGKGEFGTITVGGNGHLFITVPPNSGHVSLTSNNAHIGTNGSGEVSASGQGATWSLNDSLSVGDAGGGVLSIWDGATVSVNSGKGTIELGHQSTGEGTLYIGESETTSPGTILADKLTIGDGKGQLFFNHSADDYEFDLTISSVGTGTGTIDNTNGVTRLTRDNTDFQGFTTVTDGTLIVDKTLGGTIDVYTGGTLRGTGTVGNLLVFGTLAPGNSVGTMSVNGDATFEVNSTYRVHVDRDNASQTDVTGTATINGGTVEVISLEDDEDNLVLGTYRILEAETIDGEFDDVEDDFAFIDPSLEYDATGVYLTLVFKDDPENTDPNMDDLQPLASPFSSNANQDALVAILDTLDQSDPRYQAFETAFRDLSNDEVTAVLEELSGSRSAGTSGISASFSTALMDFVQMANGFGGFGGTGGGGQMASALTPGTIQFASAEPLARDEWDEVAQTPAPAGVGRSDGPASWVRIVGQTGRQGSADGMPGSDSRSGGLHAGIDMPVNDTFSVGAAIGYEQGRVTSGGMLGVDTESYSGAVYGRYQLDDLRLSGAFSYSRIDYDSSRTVPDFGRQSAEYGADAWNVDAQAAYDFRLGPDGLTVSPLVGVRYIGMRQEGYEESGDAGLSVGSLTSDSVRARLGAETRYESATEDGMTIALTARAAWSREIAAPETALRASLLGSDSFAIQGQGLPRDIAELGLTLDLGVSDSVDLFAAYDGSLGDDYTDHRGQAGLRFTW